MAVAVQGGLPQRQLRQLRAALASLELPPKKRQRLLWRIAKLGVIVAAKRNQRNQTSPDGQPWAPRKRGKGKMLRQLPKLLHVREMPQIDAVRIYLQGGQYKNGQVPVSAGLIGAVHQGGASFSMSADRAPRPDQRNRPALPRQAKKLRALGYKMRKGNRYVKASSKYILDTLSMAQAGLLIKKLRGEPTKTTWKIDIPSRVFLGVSDDEFNKILARQLQAIGFGWDVNAQDSGG
ncbi:phage virion morphogenesis protein [Pectobacterium atrosepticum]|uniref:phage virion morphogenesis protein n=1 Tax=Pectobacterium atrosepticum TaxID=29471 RepID=UPI0004E85500|nr:phage virion morphogenesis protein [Pectobacterium atrosepticum]AIK13762.1 Phage virion morphogenesis family protein [Pectobacterium atrosepticum]POW31973.1 hypothetical protein PB72LOC_00321 [Pectobacterium atrosepticum]PWD62296.1 hypothetical protein DF214_08625 [Pectobacterium atrosepticum]